MVYILSKNCTLLYSGQGLTPHLELVHLKEEGFFHLQSLLMHCMLRHRLTGNDKSQLEVRMCGRLLWCIWKVQTLICEQIKENNQYHTLGGQINFTKTLPMVVV